MSFIEAIKTNYNHHKVTRYKDKLSLGSTINLYQQRIRTLLSYKLVSDYARPLTREEETEVNQWLTQFKLTKDLPTELEEILKLIGVSYNQYLESTSELLLKLERADKQNYPALNKLKSLESNINKNNNTFKTLSDMLPHILVVLKAQKMCARK